MIAWVGALMAAVKRRWGCYGVETLLPGNSTFVPEYNSHGRTRYDLRKRTFLGRRYGLRDVGRIFWYVRMEWVPQTRYFRWNSNTICDSLGFF
eukprot:2449294-Rhodomonas_salina.1